MKPKNSSQVVVRKAVAARLEKFRKAAGYDSAEIFCQRNGLSFEEYQKHENAKATIRASNAIEYSKHLGISIYELMLGEDE